MAITQKPDFNQRAAVAQRAAATDQRNNTLYAGTGGNTQINGDVNINGDININLTIGGSHDLAGTIGSKPIKTDNTPTQPAYVPKPDLKLSAPPAGKGLTQIDANTYKTAGGYTIHAEGKDAAWSITGPDGKQLARVWGDPHVQEGDGTKWDFTKDSDFVLPDGTRIVVDTTAESGKSVTQGLNIINGEDRVEITGINKNAPKSTAHTDGYEYRAQHAATRTSDTFYLTHGKAEGSKESVQFVRERDGKVDGVVTGAEYTKNKDGQSYYEQKVDKNAVMLPMERPPVGSAAWGNYTRGAMTDLVAQDFQGMGKFGELLAEYFGQEMHLNHMSGEITAINNKIDEALKDKSEDKSNTLGSNFFGGLSSLFGGNLLQLFSIMEAFSSMFGSNLDLSPLNSTQIKG